MLDDVTVIRVPGGQGVLTPTPSLHGTALGSRLGILVFSHRGQLLHINRRALRLSDHLKQAAIRPVDEICGEVVHQLRFNIEEMLDHRRATGIWEPFEVKRVIVEAGSTLQVRGFGLANRNSFENSHIVIVLEEVDVRQEHQTQRWVVVSE